jgi:fatty-acyl-CoA synthase
MVLPSSNLQPEAIINILQKEKITKANGVPTSGWGLSRNEAKPTRN